MTRPPHAPWLVGIFGVMIQVLLLQCFLVCGTSAIYVCGTALLTPLCKHDHTFVPSGITFPLKWNRCVLCAIECRTLLHGNPTKKKLFIIHKTS